MKLKLMLITILTIILFSNIYGIEKKIDSVEKTQTKKIKKISKPKPSRKHNPNYKPPKTRNRIYPEKSSAELVDFGWKQFKKENYDHAVECFKELITRKDSLADAYTGLGWCDLMSFKPESDTLTYNLNEHNYQQYYPVNPNEIYELYSKEDDCPPGWINNAIKIKEDGNLMFKNTFRPKKFTTDARHYYLIGIDDYERRKREVQEGKGILLGYRKGVEYGAEDIVYDFLLVDHFDAGLYNKKNGILTINKEKFSIKEKDVLAQLSVFWYEDWNLPFFKQPGNGISRETIVDTLHVKILKRAYQTIESDTWDFFVKNGYYLSKEVVYNTLSIKVYRECKDGLKDYYLPNSSMTYNEYLRLEDTESGLLLNWFPNIKKTDYILNFPFLDPAMGLNDILGEPVEIEFIFQKKLSNKERYKLIRSFLNAEKYDPDDELLDIIQVGKLFVEAHSNIQDRYYQKMNNKKWKFKYNFKIDYRDIIIYRAITFFNDRTNKKNYLKCKQEIQKLVPDFDVEENTKLGKNHLRNLLIKLRDKYYNFYLEVK